MTIGPPHSTPWPLRSGRVYVARPVVPPLLQPDQVKVLSAFCKRLAPPVAVAVTKEEMVGHAIVTKVKEVVEAGSTTMA